MSKYFLGAYLFLMAIPCLFLSAEIQTVAITWNAGLCDEGCEKLVQRRLQDIPAVERVIVSPGEAVMYWKPGEPMTYQMIRRPTQLVGIALDAMYVKVRGTVRVDEDKVTLTSFGDNTKFILTSAPAPKYGTYVQYSAPQLYKLRPDEIEAFKKAQNEDAMVTASGFLLLPFRLDLTIVLDNYQIEQEEGNNQ